MTTPVLYSNFRSSSAWRVRIVLAHKGIDYITKSVSLFEDGEQNIDEHKIENTMFEVPTLVIDGTTIKQSLAIIEYLEETRPEKNLLPKDPVQRAKVRMIAENVNSGVQPMQNFQVLKTVGAWCQDASRQEEWARHWINRGFVVLEKALISTAGKYCVGDSVTVADALVVPQVYNATRFGVDMQEFPIISRIVADLADHPAFKASHPNNQPDCPEDFK